jgi:hypothetical protein
MRLILLFAALVSTAWAGEQPNDFPYRAPIATPGSASHYRFAVPGATYLGASRRDLGDLRVFNAAGEPVPHAFVPREAQKAEPPVVPVRLFPLYGDPAKSLDTTSVRVERNAQGTVVNVTVQNGAPPRRRALVGYLLDASELKQPLDALLLDWDATDPFTGWTRVEASDDLRSWNAVVSGSPILYLEHDGARLERRRVELGGARAHYLRVSFIGVPSAFRLRQARLELHPEKPEVEREWRSLAGVEGKTHGEWSFDSAGHFPADRVRLHLPQPNTVVQVQVLTRERADDPWRMAGAAVAYRLSRPNGEITSSDIPVRSVADRYWLVRVDQKGGGVGAGELRLEIGWVPHEIVFAARGAGPFLLAYGSRKPAEKGGPLPISAVLPRAGDGVDAVTPERASVGAVSGEVAAPPSLFRDPLRFVQTVSENRDAKKWTLWTVLVAGVGLLAWMAFRLLHEVGGDGKRRL